MAHFRRVRPPLSHVFFLLRRTKPSSFTAGCGPRHSHTGSSGACGTTRSSARRSARRARAPCPRMPSQTQCLQGVRLPACRALPRMPGHAACHVAWPDAWRGLHKLRLLLQGCARGAGRCVVPNKQIARSATTTKQLPSHTRYEKAESLHAAHRAVRRVIQPCVRTACYGINCRSLLAAAFHTAQHQLRSSTAVSTGRRLYWYVQCTAWWGQSSQSEFGSGH